MTDNTPRRAPSTTAIAERAVAALARHHLDDSSSDMSTLAREIGVRRTELRAVLCALSEEGYVHDDLMRLTLGGFALGVAMLEGACADVVLEDVGAA